MPDLLPPVALTLIANVTEAVAGVETFGTAMGAMGAEAVAAGRETAAGLDAAAAAAAKTATTTETSAAKISGSYDAILADMRALSAQADRTAEQWYLDQNKMAASTQKMAVEVESAEAKAIASTEAMGAKMDQVAATSVGAGAKVEAASKRLMTIGAAGAVVGAVAVKMAGDFESSTNRLVTSAGEIHSNLEMVRQGILGMAGEVGYSAEELSKALYTVESGGRHGAEGLQVLRAAAEGAKAENAELKTVADAVTSVLVDYHLKGEDAAAVTSKLVAATSAGKTTFEELSGAMAAVLPVASAAHVSLDDILGSLASMTVHGMSAQQSAQNLTDVIRHMQSPTQVQSKELALLGINAQDLAGKLKSQGISGTLQEIANKIKSSMGPESQKVILDLGTALKTLPKNVQDLGQKLLDGSITQAGYNKAAKEFDPIAAHQAASFATLAAGTHVIGGAQMTGAQVMQSYGQALNKATGDATGLNVALMLTGENADVTNNAVKTVAGATVEAGNHVRGWADIQGTFNQKVSEAKDGLGAMAIAVGMKLLPPVSALVGWLTDAVHWLGDNKVAADALAITIGVLLAGGLVGVIGKLAVFGGSLVMNLITPVASAIGFLRDFAMVAEGTAGGAVASFIGRVGSGAVTAVRSFGAALVEGAVAMGRMGVAAAVTTAQVVAQGVAWIAQKIAVAASAIAEGVLTAAQWLLNIAMDANPVGLVILAIAALIAIIILLVKNWDTISAWLKSVWNAFIGWAKGVWDSFAQFWVDLWNTVWKWCTDRITDVNNFVRNVFNTVINWIVQRWTDFIQFWVDLWNQIWKWCSDRLTDIRNWVQNRINDVIGFIHRLAEVPGQVSDWFGRMRDAVVDRFNDAVAFVRGIPGRILSALGDLGGLLLGAGHAIINGFLNGLKSAWNSVTSFVSGIGGWIADHKGPIDYDRQLLVPHGNAIMDGLHEGLMAGGDRVQRYLDGFTTGIGNTALSGSLSIADNTFSGSGLTSGAGGGNVYITVEGTVIAEQQLMQLVQQQTLQLAARNPTNGLALGLATGGR